MSYYCEKCEQPLGSSLDIVERHREFGHAVLTLLY